MGEKKTGSRGFWLVTAAVTLGMILSETVRSSVGAVVLPFAAAYVAAKLVRPAGVLLSRACKVKEKAGCTAWGILVCFAAGYTLTNLSGRLWEQLRSMTEKLPEYAVKAAERIMVISDKVVTHLPFLRGDGETSQLGGIVTGAFREAASELGGAAAGALSTAVSGFPGGILSVFIAVIAFLYLVADMDGVGRSIKSVMGCFASEEAVQKITRTFGGFADAVFAYLRAYMMLMLVTFVELSVGFTIIGVQNPLGIALITALIDALPLFGCGIVIVPWALWCFLEENFRRGIALLVIQAAVYLVRQFLEPKLIGRMTGVHPFVALIVLFAGLKIGGVTGMVAAPILLMSVMKMREE